MCCLCSGGGFAATQWTWGVQGVTTHTLSPAPSSPQRGQREARRLLQLPERASETKVEQQKRGWDACTEPKGQDWAHQAESPRQARGVGAAPQRRACPAEAEGREQRQAVSAQTGSQCLLPGAKMQELEAIAPSPYVPVFDPSHPAWLAFEKLEAEATPVPASERL